MAACQIRGPLCYTTSATIDKGTMCLSPCPTPGPTVASHKPHLYQYHTFERDSNNVRHFRVDWSKPAEVWAWSQANYVANSERVLAAAAANTQRAAADHPSAPSTFDPKPGPMTPSEHHAELMRLVNYGEQRIRTGNELSPEYYSQLAQSKLNAAARYKAMSKPADGRPFTPDSTYNALRADGFLARMLTGKSGLADINKFVAQVGIENGGPANTGASLGGLRRQAPPAIPAHVFDESNIGGGLLDVAPLRK